MKEKKGCFLVLLMMSLLQLRLWKETKQYLYHAQQKLTNHNKINHHILYTCGKLFKAKITDSEARFKRRATAVPNSIARIKFDFSTAASLAVLHGSSSTWFQTSYYRRAELKS